MDSSGDGGGRSRDVVAAALREAKATRFFAVMEDGSERELRAPKVRGRWERLATTASELDAERIECRDDEGVTLAVVRLSEREVPAKSRASAQRVEDTDTMSTQVERLVRIALDAADRTAARNAEAQAQVLTAALSLMNATSARASALEVALLGHIKRREADVEAAADMLDAQAQADAEVKAVEDANREAAKEQEGVMDGMMEKVVEGAVMPVIQAKLLAAFAPSVGPTVGGKAGP